MGLLIHYTTPLLYIKSKLTQPITYSSDPALVSEHQLYLENSSRTRDINFEAGDNVWVCLNSTDNTWKQGMVIRQVVGIPDSFVVEVNGQQYRQNKCDITFGVLVEDDNGAMDVGNAQHAEEQDGTENKTDRLRPRPVLKLPRVPTQATLHSDFDF